MSSPTPAASVRAPGALRPPSRVFDATAFGHSNAVRVRVVLPRDPIALPITFAGPTDGMQTQWIAFDGKGNDVVSPWPASGVLRAPDRPGAYWLVLSRSGMADTVADLALFVEHPMPNTMATGINGYHMGRWPKSADGIVPRGFIEVTERIRDFPLSPHLKLSDFVVHDAQDGYPKYLHVREALLDKIELTVAEIAQMRGRQPSVVQLHVASGFRSPAHNGGLSGSAQDSRHMYGDAADIAIDANTDGRLTEIDARLVAAAAEAVERKYPDLVGGIGIYITRDGGGWPYVHIDVRGRRARWRGGERRGAKVDSLLPAGATFDSVPERAVNGPRPAAAPAAVSAPSRAAAPVSGTIVSESMVAVPSASGATSSSAAPRRKPARSRSRAAPKSTSARP
ncbi:MAG: D-Ala-D-Ala carboxypeptidase family metallohydrolase [Gemmatimonadaceae bacterium]|nr:D-Ala-D-Ala carboxypeptidase family metallohydrolase [Gemmatimonadaceae bacterium]